MAQRTKRTSYKTINVEPEVFAHVQLVAEANGRTLGGQVKAWADRELPECEHEKVPVSIETFPGNTNLDGSRTVQGFYCPTCKRVYAKVANGSEVSEELKVRCDGGSKW